MIFNCCTQNCHINFRNS